MRPAASHPSTPAARPCAPPPVLALLLAVVVLTGMSVGVQVVRDAGWRAYEPPRALLWTQSSPLMTRLALGFNTLVADVYWMRAVVYYGGQRGQDAAARNFDLLAPLLDLVTGLDPRFKVAYRFGAIFLTEAYPDGPGRPDQAVALLERGIANDAPRWEYMHDIGFVYYWWLNDYTRAAAWFKRASDADDAPSWLVPLAANTLAVGGDRRSSRLLWEQMRSSSDIEWVRATAERRVQQLDAMDTLDQLNALAAQFAAARGGYATTWPALVQGLRLGGIPLDPTGTPYAIDAATGRIAMGPASSLLPLPTESPAPSPVAVPPPS